MLSLAKRALRHYLKRRGWTAPSAFRGPSALHLLLLQALGVHGRLHLIQVGANDGVTNDPLRPFIIEHESDVEAILFEPQREPFLELQGLYEHAPNIRCINTAIGKSAVATFYSARNGGRTTTNSFVKDSVTSRLKRAGVIDVEKHLIRHELEVHELLDVLKAHPLFLSRTDLLQVDCEGMDDEVIYHSGIDTLQPRVINFESKNLSSARLRDVTDFLTRRGYDVRQRTNADTIAILLGR